MRMVTMAAAFVGAVLAAGEASAQAKQDFQLVNRTGYQIDEVYVGPNSSDEWGDDVLGKQVFEDGKLVNIRFNPKASVCSWDIQVVYNDGDKSQFRNIDLCSVSKITLFWNRNSGTTRFVTE